MIQNLRNKYYDKWSRIYVFVMCIIFILLLAESAFHSVHNISHYFLSRYALVLLVGSYFLFRGFKDRSEIKLLWAFALWMFATRLIYFGINIPVDEIYFVYTRIFVTLFAIVGFLVPAEKRGKLTDILFTVYCVFYTLFAAATVWTYITRNNFYISSMGVMLVEMPQNRAYVIGNNPNRSAYWFMTAEFLSIYLFIRHKNLGMRIFTAAMCIINYFAITACGSRNCEIGFSVGIAIILMIFILRRLKNKTKIRIAAAVIISSLIIVPSAFLSFKGANSVSALIYSEISAEEESENSVSQTQNDAGKQDTNYENGFKDDRGLKDSGRIPIYKGALYTLKKAPERLLKGSTFDNLMEYTNEYIKKSPDVSSYRRNMGYSEHHNSFINTLIYAGLPGFILFVGFCILLVRRMLLVFFSESKEASTEIKALTAALAAMLIYNIFETLIYNLFDIREIVFFATAGVFLAYSYEIIPAKSKKFYSYKYNELIHNRKSEVE